MKVRMCLLGTRARNAAGPFSFVDICILSRYSGVDKGGIYVWKHKRGRRRDED